MATSVAQVAYPPRNGDSIAEILNQAIRSRIMRDAVEVKRQKEARLLGQQNVLTPSQQISYETFKQRFGYDPITGVEVPEDELYDPRFGSVGDPINLEIAQALKRRRTGENPLNPKNQETEEPLIPTVKPRVPRYTVG